MHVDFDVMWEDNKGWTFHWWGVMDYGLLAEKDDLK